MHGLGKIPPLDGQSIDGRLPALPGLEGEIDEEGDTDDHRGELIQRREHFPVHFQFRSDWDSGVMDMADAQRPRRPLHTLTGRASKSYLKGGTGFGADVVKVCSGLELDESEPAAFLHFKDR